MHAHYHTGGTGHLYQGRFKSFPVQDDEHLLTVMRYVERNPLRAQLVEAAEAWRWSSAAARRWKPQDRRWLAIPTWPPLPRQWRAWVNKPQSEAEVEALRRCISVTRLALESATRPRKAFAHKARVFHFFSRPRCLSNLTCVELAGLGFAREDLHLPGR